MSDANSDLAFWRNYAIEGTYTGFRIVDISNPAAPVEVSRTQCGRDQGDITISPDGNVLVRSQDAARIIPGNNQANACDVGRAATAGECGPGLTAGTCTTQLGWEGLQIFDVSNKAAPRFVGAVFTDFGSHTHTQYYDRANNRLIIYVSRSGARQGAQGTGPYQPPPATQNPYGGQNWPATNGCITAVEVPLANPAGARVVNRCITAGTAPVAVSAGGCHDVAVFEEIRKMFGACRPNHIHWDLTDPVNPTILHEMTLAGARTPHSASFSWDGRILIAGWEPGGGGEAECQAEDPANEKSIAFFSAATGALIGLWTLPRPQGPDENCTVHNYNVVPFADRHVLVHGSYQSGTSWVDFTNPGAAFEFAWSDPPSLGPGPFCGETRPPGCQLGGAWSSYWYNDEVWESDIEIGLRGYSLRASWWPAAFDFTRLNPQTQETLLRCSARMTTAPTRLRADQRATVTVRVRERGGPAAGEPVALQRVTLRGPGIRATVRTNMNGVARVRGVSASRAGTLRATLRRQLNMAGCSDSKRVLRAAVVGRPAGGRLTGSR